MPCRVCMRFRAAVETGLLFCVFLPDVSFLLRQVFTSSMRHDAVVPSLVVRRGGRGLKRLGPLSGGRAALACHDAEVGPLPRFRAASRARSPPRFIALS